MQKDLTKGSVWGNIVYFSLPFLLSYFLQTLYGLADVFIVGQYNGSDIISAVSVGSQVMHMVTVVIVGLAMGSTVLIGKAVGGKDREGEARAIGNTVSLFIGFSVVLTAILLLLTDSIVSVMMTPAEAVGQTKIYLSICFAGIPFITAYNVISSVLRGRGDSKSPMYFIAVACACNIILDIVFIGFMDMKAAGAALGTVLSQTVSVVFAFGFMMGKKTVSGLKISHLKPRRGTLADIVKVGAPIACQDAFIQISFIVITVIANSRGVEIAAAVGIVEKIIGILFLVPSAMLSTVSALSAQNIGASQHERVRKILFCGILVTVVFGLLVSVIFQFTAEWAVGLFTDEANVVVYGGQYLRSYVFDAAVAGIHFCFSGFFCAYGYSMISFVHNALSIVLVRIPGTYLAAKFFPATLLPMGVASPLGSFLSAVICVFMYFAVRRRQKKAGIL